MILTLKGQATTDYVAFLGPLAAGLLVVQRVESRSNRQDQLLDKIHENTNGVLTQRIRDAVQDALDERSQ